MLGSFDRTCCRRCRKGRTVTHRPLPRRRIDAGLERCGGPLRPRGHPVTRRVDARRALPRRAQRPSPQRGRRTRGVLEPGAGLRPHKGQRQAERPALPSDQADSGLAAQRAGTHHGQAHQGQRARLGHGVGDGAGEGDVTARVWQTTARTRDLMVGKAHGGVCARRAADVEAQADRVGDDTEAGKVEVAVGHQGLRVAPGERVNVAGKTVEAAAYHHRGGRGLGGLGGEEHLVQREGGGVAQRHRKVLRGVDGRAPPREVEVVAERTRRNPDAGDSACREARVHGGGLKGAVAGVRREVVGGDRRCGLHGGQEGQGGQGGPVFEVHKLLSLTTDAGPGTHQANCGPIEKIICATTT